MSYFHGFTTKIVFSAFHKDDTLYIPSHSQHYFDTFWSVTAAKWFLFLEKQISFVVDCSLELRVIRGRIFNLIFYYYYYCHIYECLYPYYTNISCYHFLIILTLTNQKVLQVSPDPHTCKLKGTVKLNFRKLFYVWNQFLTYF